MTPATDEGKMLSNLLPGLRELRAPFAAGALWLLAMWIRWEPLLPIPDDAKKVPGLANSFYRLHGLVPDVALGATAGLLVYLLGSLSIALLSDPLRAASRVSLSSDDRWLNPLTPATVDALHRLARRTRAEIETLVAPRGVAAGQFLDVERDAPLMRRRREGFWMRVWLRLRSSQFVEAIEEKLGIDHRRQVRARRSIMRHAAAPPPEAIAERELAELAVLDLDVVTTARLLGKDQALYSAIDRHRAEVEFRLGVIPPLLVLSVTVALRTSHGWSAGGIAMFGMATAVGLYWDALKQQRKANGLLVDAAVHKRVDFPSIEQLRASAEHFRDMTGSEAAWRVEAELARTVAIAGRLDSFPSSAEAASVALERARHRYAVFSSRLEEDVRQSADKSLAALDRTVVMWNQGVKGELPSGWFRDGQIHRETAVKQFEEFRGLIHRPVSRMADMPGSVVAEAEKSQPD
jgi:hypothetical protein